MSYSLWTVNAYANTIYDKLKGANASASVKENLSLQQQLNAEESYYNTELRKNANLQKLYKKKEKKQQSRSL